MNDPLVELALRPWGRPTPGLVQHRTGERLVELRPSFPIAGPNHVCLVRCAPDRVDAMIDETRAWIAPHRLPVMWLLDDDAAPPDIGRRLAARGIVEVERVGAMVLPASVDVPAGPPAIEIVDGLRDEATHRVAEEVQVDGFGTTIAPGQRARFEEASADAARHLFLALIDGEPAGAGWATVCMGGVIMNGGAVRPALRGRGVYRALVAARLTLARRAGAPGLVTQAKPDTSGPILAAFGFRTVGTCRMHLDA